MLVVSSEDEAARWAPVVAQRNAGGQRTALLVADPGDEAADQQAATMAAEVFTGSPWSLIDTRAVRRP